MLNCSINRRLIVLIADTLSCCVWLCMVGCIDSYIHYAVVHGMMHTKIDSQATGDTPCAMIANHTW